MSTPNSSSLSSPFTSSLSPSTSSFIFSGFDLSGRNAFITGGSSGLGKAIAKGLLAAGATVIIGSRSKSKIDSAIEELHTYLVSQSSSSSTTTSTSTKRIFGIEIDVEQSTSIQEVFTTLWSTYNQIDILVNAAGILNRAKAEDELVDDFNRVLRTNVTGTFVCCQEAAKRWKTSTNIPTGGFAILNIASLTSTIALSDVTAYACSKAAIAQLTRQLANDWSRYSIRINAIAPGVFPTDINRAAIMGTPRGEWMIKQTPMDRFGNSYEISGLAIYLCSPSASFTTGDVIPCDGGFLSRGVGPTN